MIFKTRYLINKSTGILYPDFYAVPYSYGNNLKNRDARRKLWTSYFGIIRSNFYCNVEDVVREVDGITAKIGGFSRVHEESISTP